MTYTNLPPTLFEMFGSLDDRVRKLETGPSLAYTTGEDALQQAQGAQGSSANAYAQAIIAQAQAAAASVQALTAQSTASNAQVQAANASAQANIAQSQATVAQSTASFAQQLAWAAQATANSASAQATVAQTTANGKNSVYYSLVTPGTTANKVGDIWFQYSGSGLVIAQYVGLGGTSWQQQTITQAVIGNLDAGKITTGILNAISINSGGGSQYFNVTATGFLSVQGAYVKGNITADSGTFNGTINAGSGTFGNVPGGNYWSIGASGLTAVGTGTITGGLIQGSSIAVPQVSPKFQVDNAGNMTASSAAIQGTVWAKQGYIGDPAGSNVWQITGSGIQGVGTAYIYAGAITGTTITGGTIQTSTGSDSITLNGSANALTFKGGGSNRAHMVPLNVGGITYGVLLHYGTTADPTGGTYPQLYIDSAGLSFSSLSGSTGALYSITQSLGHRFQGQPVTVIENFTANSQVFMPNLNTTTNAANMRRGTAGGGQVFEVVSSSQRFKENIVALDSVFDLDPKKLLDLPVRAFTYKSTYLPNNDERSEVMLPGFIAEEVDAIYPIAADYDSSGPINWNDRLIIPGMLSLIQNLNKRLETLEGNNG